MEKNLLERACSHRLVFARCWPVKPKSSLGGFSFGFRPQSGDTDGCGPDTLHGPVLMSEHVNETGCAMWEPARGGLKLGTTENRLSDVCHVGVDRPGLASTGAGQVPDSLNSLPLAAVGSPPVTWLIDSPPPVWWAKSTAPAMEKEK